MHWPSLIACIFLCLAVGIVSSRWTAPEIPTWYRGLRKPSFNPPNWIFAPVWTTLYILMGVAAWRVFIAPASSARSLGLAVFVLQLTLNFFWSYIFFHRHALGAALAEVLVLWVFIAVSLGAFARVEALAAWLLVPYLAWVSFASVLNAALWRLNPSQNALLARTATPE